MESFNTNQPYANLEEFINAINNYSQDDKFDPILYVMSEEGLAWFAPQIVNPVGLVRFINAMNDPQHIVNLLSIVLDNEKKSNSNTQPLGSLLEEIPRDVFLGIPEEKSLVCQFIIVNSQFLQNLLFTNPSIIDGFNPSLQNWCINFFRITSDEERSPPQISTPQEGRSYNQEEERNLSSIFENLSLSSSQPSNIQLLSSDQYHPNLLKSIGKIVLSVLSIKWEGIVVSQDDYDAVFNNMLEAILKTNSSFLLEDLGKMAIDAMNDQDISTSDALINAYIFSKDSLIRKYQQNFALTSFYEKNIVPSSDYANQEKKYKEEISDFIASIIKQITAPIFKKQIAKAICIALDEPFSSNELNNNPDDLFKHAIKLLNQKNTELKKEKGVYF